MNSLPHVIVAPVDIAVVDYPLYYNGQSVERWYRYVDYVTASAVDEFDYTMAAREETTNG